VRVKKDGGGGGFCPTLEDKRILAKIFLKLRHFILFIYSDLSKSGFNSLNENKDDFEQISCL
jgi:hypothetical protein